MQSYLKETKTTRVSNAVAAGTSDINSTSVDMANFLAVAFKVFFGAIVTAAVTVVKLQGSNDDSTFVDLETTGQTVADDDDNEVFILDCVRPPYRYIRCVVDRGTQNATVDAIEAIQYQARFLPVTQPTGVNGELATAPIAGTA